MIKPILTADALAERVFSAALGTFDIFAIHIGDQLGFYRALGNGEAMTSAELAASTRTNERSTREWLEQQGVSGMIVCENPADDALARRSILPSEYHELFLEPDSLATITPIAQIVVGAVHPIDQLIEAFRDNGGVPYEDYGVNLAEGQARFNRPMLRSQLVQEWIPALPDIAERFASDPPARMADIGMGYGWSSIALAQAFPKILVDGYDLDEASVVAATALAADEQVSDRVTFHFRDAGDTELQGRYDLALAVECIHDMSDPVSVLSAMRRLVGPGGTVLIVDEKVPDDYSAPGTDADRYYYGFSVLHCLPVGLVDQPSVGTGTVIRQATMRDYAQQAGFQSVEVLPVEHDFFNLYRMTA